MSPPLPGLAQRIVEATDTVFGDTPLSRAVRESCERYAHDLENIQAGRGINALLIAIVGAKGQGKTWVARQFVRDPRVREMLPSGDLLDDATTRLVWIGPVAPEGLDPQVEIHHACSTEQMAAVGQPYVLLDTPGLTDADHHAAHIAAQALSLAPLKLLVIARDQLRAASNMHIAHQIDGAMCIPVISSVEPTEMPNGEQAGELDQDLKELAAQLALMSPRSTILPAVLVPDFEISGDESAAGQVFLSGLLDRMNDAGLTSTRMGTAREMRLNAASERLRENVSTLIAQSLPQLAEAVQQLHRETEHLPERVLESLLGSETVLAMGVRLRLRARLVSDTSLLWFPYRTLMGTLHLTQGAWDRVLLALSGSVPSLFGALASLAKNVNQGHQFTQEIQEGIRQRTQQQVAERLQPLCDQFHQAVLKLRPRQERSTGELASVGMRLAGIEELQTRSHQIFDRTLARHATHRWLVQLLGAAGALLFWAFMAGPIVLIYREYFLASYDVLSGGGQSHLDDFPHPSPALLFTSLLLSLLPLALYGMLVLTLILRRRRVERIAAEIMQEHQRAIEELKSQQVIRLVFQDRLLQQAEFLLQF